MSDSKPSKLHIAMVPWFAFGHFISFLHLSNKLAEKGHEVSFLLPKGAHPKLKRLNQHPDLIQFLPLVVPHVDGLPPGVEIASDVALQLQGLLAVAFDQTRDQVETTLRAIKPDMVFYDFGHWVPALARQIGIKSIFYCTVPAAAVVPATEVPTDFPYSKVKLDAQGVADMKLISEIFDIGVSFQERVDTALKDSDAIAYRTHREVEGSLCDHVAQYYGKPVLLTGPCLPETDATKLEEKWVNWLSNFEPSSVVYCAFGSQVILQKEEFQELVLGFELSGQPFLVALKPPEGFSTVEEAFPEGFQERIQGKGLVYGGWVPQELILSHPSVGCFVSHCGYGSTWEALLSDCQIVPIPRFGDQVFNARLMVEELKVAVEVEKGENRKISRQNLSKAVKLVMDKDDEMAGVLKRNHAKLRELLSNRDFQGECINNFIQGLQDLVKK